MGFIGGGGTVYDRDCEGCVFPGRTKTACLAGTIPADGLLFSGHGNCNGCVEWYGHMAFCSMGEITLTGAAAKADRLLTGGTAVKAGVDETAPQDWKTYRANNSRSGSSPAAVPGKVTTVWMWTPNQSFDSKDEIERGYGTAIHAADLRGGPCFLRHGGGHRSNALIGKPAGNCGTIRLPVV